MIKSYPKVNLILKVYKRKKTEIKHRIKSLFVLDKSIFDVINIKKSKIFSIKYFLGSKSIQIKNCLIKKSLNYLSEKFGIDVNYEIVVNKSVNLMSGLGGGSSNAANIILYILKHNNIKVSFLDMEDIALNLGSDIPFFISKFNSAIVSNYGDKIEKINLPKISYKVLTNKILVSTKDVFEKMDSDEKYISKVEFKKCLNSLLNKKFNNHYIYNDLQTYIFKVSQKLFKEFNKHKGFNKIICGSGGSILLIK